MKGQEVQDLIKLIDSSSVTMSKSISKENMYMNSTRVYFQIKAMYQSFKKQNEFQLLQDKIHKIVIHQQKAQNYKLTDPSAETICKGMPSTRQNIETLISIKDYLSKQSHNLMLDQIMNKLMDLQDIQNVLHCLKTILKSQSCVYQKNTLYKKVQQKMNQIILRMPIKDQHFKKMSQFIISLPFIGENTLQLIGDLFVKVDQLKSFDCLYYIFQNHFPSNPSPSQIKSLLKISNPSSKEIIIKLIQKYQIVLPLAEAQAKIKLNTTQNQITEKVQSILDFIVLVIGYGRNIWSELIQWQKRASPECKNFLKSKIQNVLLQMMRNEKYFGTILTIASKMTTVDQHSEIGMIFFNEFLIIKDKKYLNNPIIRKMIAWRVIKQPKQVGWQTFFDKSLVYSEIVLEIFMFDKVGIDFFRDLILDIEKNLKLKLFLSTLVTKQPVKFKEFFLKVDQCNKAQLLNNIQFLSYLTEIMPIQVAFGFFRDVATLPPSPHLITIMTNAMRIYQNHQLYPAIKAQIIKTLNTILLLRNTEELNDQFMILFLMLYKALQSQQKSELIKDVPEKKLEPIKRCYESFSKIRI